MKLVFQNVTFRYGKKQVLDGVSGELCPGKFVSLLGENGSGKSTLLKILAGVAEPESGRVLLDGNDLHHLSRRDAARHFGVVRQTAPPALDYTVRELALFGRNAKLPPFSGGGREDFFAVDRALERVALDGKKTCFANTLSGGEFQRLVLAAALALEGDFLLLDEPTSAQDPVFTQLVAEILREESKTRGVLVISHDLMMISRFADEAWLLGNGRIFGCGAPENVFTPEHLGKLYRCHAEIGNGRDFRFFRKR